MTFARLHETRDAALVASLVPVRTRLLPALAVFERGRFQRLLPTGARYVELDANLVGAYPDRVVTLPTAQDVARFMEATSSKPIVVFSVKFNVCVFFYICFC
jgi:hypothetical protein